MITLNRLFKKKEKKIVPDEGTKEVAPLEKYDISILLKPEYVISFRKTEDIKDIPEEAVKKVKLENKKESLDNLINRLQGMPKETGVRVERKVAKGGK